jgi:anthranilate phosphoribosyltransferase
VISEAIAHLVARQDLTSSEAEAVMSYIVDGRAAPIQVGAFLLALRMKGETAQEIVGCAQALHRGAALVHPKRTDLVDISGTGGDRSGTFNISTTTAFVVAGAGLAVAKHVDRSVSSRCGSAEVLNGLGVDLQVPPSRVAACIDEIGIGFLYAPRLFPALQYTLVPRRQIGIRTVLDLLGPLSNPAGAKTRVLGVYDSSLTGVLAEALCALGDTSAFVVHGSDGLDEFSTIGSNTVSRLDGGMVSTYTFDPISVGLPRASLAEIRGGLPAQNVYITRAVLEGARGASRDIVALNAAAALVAGQMADSIESGLALAAEAIDSGKARDKLSELVAFTQDTASDNQSLTGDGQ